MKWNTSRCLFWKFSFVICFLNQGTRKIFENEKRNCIEMPSDSEKTKKGCCSGLHLWFVGWRIPKTRIDDLVVFLDMIWQSFPTNNIIYDIIKISDDALLRHTWHKKLTIKWENEWFDTILTTKWLRFSTTFSHYSSFKTGFLRHRTKNFTYAHL